MNFDFIPQNLAIMTPEEAACLNPLVLSFVGDSVQTLFVRAKLAATCQGKTNALHAFAARQVNAKRQSEAMHTIESMLQEDEVNIFLRARNAKANTLPKHATIAEYKYASGFEAILGYLYLIGSHERLGTLMAAAYDNKEKE